jgi:polysaccharide biosynthesis/export protein
MTILKALALARGATLTAKLNDALILRKMPNGKTEEIKVRLKDVMSQKTPDLPLYANDILFVPDSGAKRAFYKAANAAVGITSGVIVYRSTQ